ncbi:hypothetical protein M430DRAFT_97522 [Amorphotheca resinae ATCC 22711]|jgi:acetyl esterase/lipase|uniref:Alpha/beta hydrolase fold-3 domain-containing protein n=1 Tax=Amorphotheca resinae ATCC 22711 TaxID=857342 RepID=A0A2T3B950_AMORE|nr:hypothetical protein M430DRAFT_97522 [Amorphotheca resinae ATCC 22711]PSS23400.1 hypothetical protein M430DRAFT_97522 [Amorphotheca resinae ATCC 22711]
MAAQTLLTRQPFKGLWVILAIGFNAFRLPLWMLYYIPKFLRQHPEWTYRQAIGVRILKAYLNTISPIAHGTSTSLSPGAEGKRWVIVKPAKPEVYTGIVKKDEEIVPEKLGGTWYPKTLEKYEEAQGEDIVLHFHGGAFVIGDGREKDAGFAARTIIKNTTATHVFCPQYRLSSIKGGRFPAALQDAITAFQYLTETLGIPANKITISGDSAGGNLCLSLLRYIADHPEAGLPNPACAWLWSAWVDPGKSLKPGVSGFDPKIVTDYLNEEFGAWGARTYAPSPKSGITLDHPNICFADNAFATPTPLFFSTGECEALYPDDVKLYESFKAVPGNKVVLQVERKAVHDIILTGKVVGFEKEAAEAVRGAGVFLEGSR